MNLLPYNKQGLATISGSEQVLAGHRSSLTFKYWDIADEVQVTVKGYLDISPTCLGVPRAYAMHGFADVCKFDVAGQDFEFGDTPERPTLRDEQVGPVDEVVKGFEIHYDQILKAYTGSGKTVMGCEIAARLGLSTLILVDQNKLARQWEDTLVNLFGYALDDIGSVQGGNVDYRKRDFTIGMVQSIYDREFPDDFYDQFGFVVYDEYHTVGAEQFSNVLSMFPAECRLGTSATDRKDGKQELINWHLNHNRIIMEDERKPSQARYVEYSGNIPSWYAQISPKDGRYITEIAADPERNELLAEIVMRLYDMDRTILVIGARIHQLECIRQLCIMSGMAEDDALLFTGSVNVWRYRKNNKPEGHPSGWVEGTAYTPVHLVLHNRKVNLSKLDDLLYTTRVIFSTYSIFSKGVDVPQLDAGVDTTPKTAFEQIHGRVLRVLAGKLIPIWVTIRDINSFRAEYQFSKRIGDFVKSKAEVYLWNLELGIKKLPAAVIKARAKQRNVQLKTEKIVTSADGKNITITQNTGRP